MAQVASGHVRDRPFARTIYALVARRFTGEVTLEEAGRTYRVAWQDGVVVAAASPLPSDSLARVAVDAGVLTQAQLTDVLAATARGMGEREALSSIGELTPDRVVALQRRALAHRAMRMFAVPSASFTMDDAVALGVDADVPPLDGRWVIYNGLRNHYDEARLRSELEFLAGQAVRLRPEALSVLAAFGFVDGDRALLAALRDRPLTLEDLGAGETEAERCARLSVVYALAASSCLAATAAPALAAAPPPSPKSAAPPPPKSAPSPPPKSAAPPPPTPPRAAAPAPSSSGDADPLAELVAAKLAAIDRGADHFTMLGVGRDASVADLQRAYFDLAKSLHPDRLRASRIAEPRADSVFAVVNQAFAVISNAAKRAEYVELLAAGNPAERRKAERDAETLALRLINAEVAFQRGEMALKGGNIAAALAAFTEAVELNPDDGEHHALLGWTTWCSNPDKNVIGKQVRASFRKAISLSPKSVAAYFYRGQVAKQSGQIETAEECFRKVLELDPEHRDAETELRLLDKRTEKKGLFDRLKR